MQIRQKPWGVTVGQAPRRGHQFKDFLLIFIDPHTIHTLFTNPMKDPLFGFINRNYVTDPYKDTFINTLPLYIEPLTWI